ncbi:hypothetical protein [Porphyromonas gingivalis]|uniref:Uncharacterized protein n=3 Tax=Viruses TaxID=10239 RepID=A0AAT9J959_9CAUD|nr:hypothetical protein [Porphyromonas gingivalis]ATS06046.1 hypothetical protein CS387_03045 [Porphyromonas gingivalis]ERJ70622.1 hypothetical protein HMPREF1553_00167 [Porphyromonas gingivalis F0568]MCE8187115.1 hypothetical protein [Porphyromonas gingivalis]
MSIIEQLEKLHPDIVESFLLTGQSAAMTPEVQIFVRQIQWAAEIYDSERNISRAAKKLRLRILSEQNIVVDVRTCKSRVYTAISYFSIDNNVATKIWESDFADKYEDLASLSIIAGDIKTAKRCYDSAHECRVRASEAANRESAWAPVFIISPDISLTQLGFETKNLKAIARKSNEGFYARFLEDLPIDKADKVRLLNDANIEDATFEELETE